MGKRAFFKRNSRKYSKLFPDSDIELLEKVIQRYKDIDVWNKTPS